MNLFISLLFLFLVPSNAWGWVPHEYPALFTHQLGRIFFLIAFVLLLWAFLKNRLYKQKGWKYFFLSVIFFIVWDLAVFIGRIAESWIDSSHIIGGSEGWEYFKRYMSIEGKEYVYYIARLDYLLLNFAMLLFYIGLRGHLKQAKTQVLTVLLPLLPILISDIAGAIVFVVLSIISLFSSIKLYRRERENILWNYMVWFSSSWVFYSLSRSFGHVIRHILIATGNSDTWKHLDGITGSINSLNLFLVSSVSIYFIWIYKMYLEIAEDKRQLEKDKMELKELDELKSNFLASVSHELRTPMNAIIGYTDLLLDRVDGPINEEQGKSLKKIASHSRDLLQLINRVLEIAMMESGKTRFEPKEIDLKRLIKSIIPSFEPMIEQKGITLSVNIDKSLPLIYGDEDKVKEILINLLSNAIKFTHKGRVTITAKLSERGIKPGELPLFAEVCVEDTGIGMKEEDLCRIFDKFVQLDSSFTRQYGGTGLGLSIARGLVTLHKGVIWVKSTYGEGSIFCFTLPLKKEILLEKLADPQ